MKTALSLILALSFFVVTRAGEGDPVPITQMGRNLLPRTDVVVLGSPGDSSRLGAGTILVGFHVMETIRGDLKPGRILVLTADPDYFPLGNPSCVLFLAQLGRGRYEPLGRVEISDRDGQARLATLRKYIEIEDLPTLDGKIKSLHAFLIQNLFSNEHFLVWSAARELVPFSAQHPDAFSQEEFETIAEAASDTREDTLEELLLATLQNLEHLRPADTEEVPVPERARVARTLPPPPEFRQLQKAWTKPGLKDDEREMIITALIARHLKHAFPILLAALSDELPAIRVIAARNLGETLSPDAAKPLLALVATEKNPLVLEAAVQSLGVLKHVPALKAIRDLSSLPTLLRACAFAAARIGGVGGEEILTGIRAEHSGDDPSDLKVRQLVDFLRSSTFERQEQALDKVRRQRIR